RRTPRGGRAGRASRPLASRAPSRRETRDSRMSRTTDKKRVLLVYNTDYCEELKSEQQVDQSAVEQAARSVEEGVRACGHLTELVGIAGPDIAGLIERLRAHPPDLVFNLCESLCRDTRNELLLPALLEMFRIAYTGPGPLTIASCLHKD